MLKLLLLRHAKSANVSLGIADRERPLNPRGREAASRIGLYLREHGLRPDVVHCSPAERARQTWELAGDELEDMPEWHIAGPLYDFSGASAYSGFIATLPAEARTVMLVGHNPSIGELAMTLAADGAPDAREALQRKYPTAALCELHFDAPDWQTAMTSGGTLIRFVRPKDLAPPA